MRIPSSKRRGQAMIEYSSIVWFGVVVALLLGVPVVRVVYQALQVYVDMYYYSFNLAF